jgi:aminoglycoside 3-N-acetyltransferase
VVVEVHSSLSSLGYVHGGAETVIKSLMEVVGEEGTIVMSAYLVTLPLPLTAQEKAEGIIAKVRMLDEAEDCRSGMGVIADTFRKWPETFLGTGTHRVCAWGREAERYTREGYKYLLERDGWALLIGVGITRLSSMHTAEGKVERPQAVIDYFRPPEEILKRYPESQWYVEYHDPQKPLKDYPWEKVRIEAERRGLIQRGKIGQAECMLFKARRVVDIYEEFLRTDPYGMYELERD